MCQAESEYRHALLLKRAQQKSGAVPSSDGPTLERIDQPALHTTRMLGEGTWPLVMISILAEVPARHLCGQLLFQCITASASQCLSFKSFSILQTDVATSACSMQLSPLALRHCQAKCLYFMTTTCRMLIKMMPKQNLMPAQTLTSKKIVTLTNPPATP